MSPKIRRLLEWTGFGAGAMVFGLLGLCAMVVLGVGDPAPHFVGNHRDNLAAIELGADDAYKFAVLGDTQKGVTGTRRLIARLRDEGIAFAVHTGDLVSNNDPGHYRWARWALLTSGLQVPIVVVPGNHDIKGSSSTFERQLGPLEVEFARGQVRFITVDDAMGTPPPRAALEKRLKAAGDAPIVLFMHVPPFDTKAEKLQPTPGFEDLIHLVRKYGVRYVICGHAHLYRRLEDGGTVYIVNGCGGDSDSWQFNQRVYGTVLEVSGRAIKDRVVDLPPSQGLWDNVQHLALGHVAEAYRREPVWCWGGTVILLAGWIWLTARLWRKRATA